MKKLTKEQTDNLRAELERIFNFCKKMSDSGDDIEADTAADQMLSWLESAKFIKLPSDAGTFNQFIKQQVRKGNLKIVKR